jgi:hypothetical protein
MDGLGDSDVDLDTEDTERFLCVLCVYCGVVDFMVAKSRHLSLLTLFLL